MEEPVTPAGILKKGGLAGDFFTRYGQWDCAAPAHRDPCMIWPTGFPFSWQAIEQRMLNSIDTPKNETLERSNGMRRCFANTTDILTYMPQNGEWSNVSGTNTNCFFDPDLSVSGDWGICTDSWSDTSCTLHGVHDETGSGSSIYCTALFTFDEPGYNGIEMKIKRTKYNGRIDECLTQGGYNTIDNQPYSYRYLTYQEWKDWYDSISTTYTVQRDVDPKTYTKITYNGTNYDEFINQDSFALVYERTCDPRFNDSIFNSDSATNSFMRDQYITYCYAQENAEILTNRVFQCTTAIGESEPTYCHDCTELDMGAEIGKIHFDSTMCATYTQECLDGTRALCSTDAKKGVHDHCGVAISGVYGFEDSTCVDLLSTPEGYDLLAENYSQTFRTYNFGILERFLDWLNTLEPDDWIPTSTVPSPTYEWAFNTLQGVIASAFAGNQIESQSLIDTFLSNYCADTIGITSKTDYNYSDIFWNSQEVNYQKMCSCHWPDSFYLQVRDQVLTDFPYLASITNPYYCWFVPCPILGQDFYPQTGFCEDPACFQIATIVANATTIQDTDFSIDQVSSGCATYVCSEASCYSVTSSASSTSASALSSASFPDLSSSSSSGAASTGGFSSWIIWVIVAAVAVAVIIVIVITGVILYFVLRKKKPPMTYPYYYPYPMYR